MATTVEDYPAPLVTDPTSLQENASASMGRVRAAVAKLESSIDTSTARNPQSPRTSTDARPPSSTSFASIKCFFDRDGNQVIECGDYIEKIQAPAQSPKRVEAALSDEVTTPAQPQNVCAADEGVVKVVENQVGSMLTASTKSEMLTEGKLFDLANEEPVHDYLDLTSDPANSKANFTHVHNRCSHFDHFAPAQLAQTASHQPHLSNPVPALTQYVMEDDNGNLLTTTDLHSAHAHISDHTSPCKTPPTHSSTRYPPRPAQADPSVALPSEADSSVAPPTKADPSVASPHGKALPERLGNNLLLTVSPTTLSVLDLSPINDHEHPDYRDDDNCSLPSPMSGKYGPLSLPDLGGPPLPSDLPDRGLLLSTARPGRNPTPSTFVRAVSDPPVPLDPHMVNQFHHAQSHPVAANLAPRFAETPTASPNRAVTHESSMESRRSSISPAIMSAVMEEFDDSDATREVELNEELLFETQFARRSSQGSTSSSGPVTYGESEIRDVRHALIQMSIDADTDTAVEEPPAADTGLQVSQTTQTASPQHCGSQGLSGVIMAGDTAMYPSTFVCATNTCSREDFVRGALVAQGRTADALIMMDDSSANEPRTELGSESTSANEPRTELGSESTSANEPRTELGSESTSQTEPASEAVVSDASSMSKIEVPTSETSTTSNTPTTEMPGAFATDHAGEHHTCAITRKDQAGEHYTCAITAKAPAHSPPDIMSEPDTTGNDMLQATQQVTPNSTGDDQGSQICHTVCTSEVPVVSEEDCEVCQPQAVVTPQSTTRADQKTLTKAKAERNVGETRAVGKKAGPSRSGRKVDRQVRSIFNSGKQRALKESPLRRGNAATGKAADKGEKGTGSSERGSSSRSAGKSRDRSLVEDKVIRPMSHRLMGLRYSRGSGRAVKAANNESGSKGPIPRLVQRASRAFSGEPAGVASDYSRRSTVGGGGSPSESAGKGAPVSLQAIRDRRGSAGAQRPLPDRSGSSTGPHSHTKTPGSAPSTQVTTSRAATSGSASAPTKQTRSADRKPGSVIAPRWKSPSAPGTGNVRAVSANGAPADRKEAGQSSKRAWRSAQASARAARAGRRASISQDSAGRLIGGGRFSDRSEALVGSHSSDRLSVTRALQFSPERRSLSNVDAKAEKEVRDRMVRRSIDVQSRRSTDDGHGSAQRARVTVIRPFNLTGEGLQQQTQMALEEARKQVEEVEARRRVFHARPMPDFSKPFPPPKSS